MPRVNCNANQWTQVLWTVGPFPYRSIVNYVDWLGSTHTISIRRYSGGPQWYWEGWIAANTPMFFWHSPIDWYASVEVYPNAWPATVEVTLVG